MSYLGAGADWRKRNYLIEPDTGAVCANTGAVNRIAEALFTPEPGIITFEEVALLAQNPLITEAMSGCITDVQFGPILTGMAYTNIFDPFGTGGFKDAPTAPLSMVLPGAIPTRTVNDGAWDPPFSPPRVWAGGDGDFTLGIPYVMLFTEDVVGVGFTLGGFNTVGNVRVRAYARDGTLLGTWFNVGPLPDFTFEDFFLNRDSNVAIIAAVTVEISVAEDLGVSMKNVVFSSTCA